jgi:hypothetical protein
MKVPAIPAELEEEFNADYAQWCAREDVKSMLVKQGSRTDHVVHNPYVTTNTANPFKAWVVKAIFQDVNRTFDDFLKAYPRWNQNLD